MPGVAAPDTTLVCNGTCPEGKNPGDRIFGDPAQSENPAAADTNTYYKYGDQNWKTLTQNADIKLSGGTVNIKTLPSVTGTGRCNYSDLSNWGDPGRTTTCADYFPIIFIDGNLKIQANSRGQGVLLVNGDMEMAGGFEFNGILIVRDDIKSTGNGNKISGSECAVVAVIALVAGHLEKGLLRGAAQDRIIPRRSCFRWNAPAAGST